MIKLLIGVLGGAFLYSPCSLGVPNAINRPPRMEPFGTFVSHCTAAAYGGNVIDISTERVSELKTR